MRHSPVSPTTFTAGYARATGGGGGTCGPAPATLSVVTGSCTINVVFTPTAAGASTGTFTINANVAVHRFAGWPQRDGRHASPDGHSDSGNLEPDGHPRHRYSGSDAGIHAHHTGNVNLTGINMAR